jgi:hypothetical protein
MLHTAGIPKSADRIAIVGIGCSFPGGVEAPDSLWQFLRRGGDAVVEVPADRWNVDAITIRRLARRQDGLPAGRSVTRRRVVDAGFSESRRARRGDDPAAIIAQVVARSRDAGFGRKRPVAPGLHQRFGEDYHGIRQFGRRQIAFCRHGGALSIVANRLSHRFGCGPGRRSIPRAVSLVAPTPARPF